VRGDHRRDGERGVRRILASSPREERYGATVVAGACAGRADLGVADYRFVGAISSARAGALTLRQAIRSSGSSPTTATSSRGRPRRSGHERRRTATRPAPAALLRPRRRLETRLVEAQAEKLPPIDFLSRLVQDELLRRQDRLSNAE